jgi:hypothetical protein
MSRHLPAALAAVIILLGGTVHGVWTNRWRDNTELQYAVEHLPTLPKTLGQWEGTDVEADETQRLQFQKAQIRVGVIRTYVNRITGDQIQLMAVCGPPVPITGHNPETCYDGAGFTKANEPKRIAITGNPASGSSDATFLEADFRSVGTMAQSGLKIYWAWRGNGSDTKWEVSDSPRFHFASYRALYKIYVIREMLMADPSPVKDEVGPDFIRALLPAMQSAVFAPSASARPSA